LTAIKASGFGGDTDRSTMLKDHFTTPGIIGLAFMASSERTTPKEVMCL